MGSKILKELILIIIETIGTVLLLSIFDYDNVSQNIIAVLIGNLIFFVLVGFIKLAYYWRDNK